MRFQGICYRAHDPQWAYLPLSGEGAALRGGRFNPKGTPALYLALTLETAILEANQGFAHKIEPCLLVSYEVDCQHIADLRAGETREALNVNLADMACPWALDVAQRREPASWRVVNDLIGGGYRGALVPSFAQAAKPHHQNLVLWQWGAKLPNKVEIIDPNGRLPKDQASWKR